MLGDLKKGMLIVKQAWVYAPQISLGGEGMHTHSLFAPLIQSNMENVGHTDASPSGHIDTKSRQ